MNNVQKTALFLQDGFPKWYWVNKGLLCLYILKKKLMVTSTDQPTNQLTNRANIGQSAFSKVRQKKKGRDLQLMTAFSVLFLIKSTTSSTSTVRGQFKYKYVYRTSRRTLKRYRTIAGVQKITQWPEMIPHLITITTAATVPLGTK